ASNVCTLKVYVTIFNFGRFLYRDTGLGYNPLCILYPSLSVSCHVSIRGCRLFIRVKDFMYGVGLCRCLTCMTPSSDEASLTISASVLPPLASQPTAFPLPNNKASSLPLRCLNASCNSKIVRIFSSSGIASKVTLHSSVSCISSRRTSCHWQMVFTMLLEWDLNAATSVVYILYSYQESIVGE
ncbi:hypothetical protein SK128_006265, partial [Halocaridina rubra]